MEIEEARKLVIIGICLLTIGAMNPGIVVFSINISNIMLSLGIFGVIGGALILAGYKKAEEEAFRERFLLEKNKREKRKDEVSDTPYYLDDENLRSSTKAKKKQGFNNKINIDEVNN